MLNQVLLAISEDDKNCNHSLCMCKLCEQTNTLFFLGNNHMKEENYRCAVECYTKAIDLDLRNAVYYCNRYLQLQALLIFFFFALSTLIAVFKQQTGDEQS